MIDVTVGQPYTGALLIQDSNGAAVTSGVTGSMSLYGPSFATAIGGPTALSHFGEGNWGVTWAGSLLTTSGLYRYSVPTITFGAVTLTNQGGTFQVGYLTPGTLTLRDMLIALCLPLDDGFWGTTTSAGALNGSTDGTLIDSRLINANGVVDDYLGSEVLPFQSATPTSVLSKPYRVKAFAPSTGTVTLLPVQPALIASGTDYLFCNINGMGFGIQRRLLALRAALRKGGIQGRASDQVTVTAADSTDEYAIAQQLASITAVSAQLAGEQADRWTAVGPGRWPSMVRADRRLLTLRGYPTGSKFLVSGYARPELPYFLDHYVSGPTDWYITQAAADLLKASPLQEHQRKAGPLYQEAAATRPRRTPDANEIMLG